MKIYSPFGITKIYLKKFNLRYQNIYVLVHCNPLQGPEASQGNPCNEKRIPATRIGFPVMKTGFSL